MVTARPANWRWTCWNGGRCGGEEVTLTRSAGEVLVYLLRHKNQAVTARDMLGREVWKEPAHALTNVIDVYINAALRPQAGAPRPVATDSHSAAASDTACGTSHAIEHPLAA